MKLLFNSSIPVSRLSEFSDVVNYVSSAIEQNDQFIIVNDQNPIVELINQSNKSIHELRKEKKQKK